MGFFDDLGKRVSDVGQRAVQKTQEMSEVARFNSMITQNESKINDIYYQIGKLYANVHKNDAEEDFVGMVKTVNELEQQNNEIRKKIQDVKGVQRCPKCGAEVPKEAAFCNFCGTPMPKNDFNEALADGVQCPRCGAIVKKGMRFCTSCGQAMPSPENQTESAEAPEQEIKEKKCPKCGATVGNDSVFCAECGTKLN